MSLLEIQKLCIEPWVHQVTNGNNRLPFRTRGVSGPSVDLVIGPRGVVGPIPLLRVLHCSITNLGSTMARENYFKTVAFG